MITYLKNENSVIRVDNVKKSILLLTHRGDSQMIRIDEGDIRLYAEVTVIKKEEGFFVDATEQEFLEYKEKVKERLSKFLF
jgi:hypothetical protein